MTIGGAAQRASRKRDPGTAQQILEQATRLLISRIAKSKRPVGLPRAA
jgi:hypothetical protein